MILLIIVCLFTLLIDSTVFFKVVDTVESILYEEYTDTSADQSNNVNPTNSQEQEQEQDLDNIKETKQKTASDAADLLQQIKREGDLDA